MKSRREGWLYEREISLSEKIRVLIADDHALLREGLRKILEMEADVEVVGEAADGNEVVEKCHALQPHVVLMDVNMPHGGGLNATRKIRQEMPHVNVVVLTIHDGDEYVAELVNAGAKGYILKDMEPSKVVEAVRRVRHGEAFIPPNLMAKLIEHLQGSSGQGDAPAAPGLVPPVSQLTERELEVLQLIVNGKTNRDIAEILIISEKTVKNHVTNILKKLNLSDRTQAAVYAIRHNLVTTV